MHKAFSMKHLTLIGMMGALASVLMLFRFPLPFMPPFLSFDLAGVPELIGGFVLRVGDIEEDYSMKGRLNRLERRLAWR